MELFDILQIPYNSSPDEARKAYRKIVKLLHPDRPTGDHKRFVELQEKWTEFQQLLKGQPASCPCYEHKPTIKVKYRQPPESFYQNLQRRAQYGDTIKFYPGYEIRGMLIATGYYLYRYVQFYKVVDVPDPHSAFHYDCSQIGSPTIDGTFLVIHGENKNQNSIESILQGFVFKHGSVQDLLGHYDFSLFIDLTLHCPLDDPFLENYKDCQRLRLKVKTTMDSTPTLKTLLKRFPQVLGVSSPRRKKGLCIRESNWYSTFRW